MAGWIWMWEGGWMVEFIENTTTSAINLGWGLA